MKGVPLARVLERLDPFGALGAIFQKEVYVSGRRVHTYIVRGVYALLLVGVAAVGGLGFAESLRYSGNAERMQSLQGFAPGIAVALAWIQFFVLYLVAPALTAGALCDEVRTRTLALLLTTPMKASQIVLGKLAGRCVQLLILALIPTPLLLAVRTFGGLPADAILAVAAIGLSNALLAAAAALCFSAGVRRASSALVMSVVLVLALHGLLPLGLTYLNHRLSLGIGSEHLISLSSFATLMTTTMGYITGSIPMAGIEFAYVWGMNVAYSLAVAALLTGIAMVRLRRIMRREAGDPARASARGRRGPPGGDDASRFSARDREVGDRPVLWREVRQPTFRRAWQLWAGLLLAALLLAWLTFELRDDLRTMMFGTGVVAMLIVLLIAASISTPLIAGEREARTWEVLLATPLSAKEIILGKLAGALRRLWAIPALYLGYVLLVGVLSGTVEWWFMVLAPLTMFPAVLFLVAGGLCLSLEMRRGVAAGVVNIGIAAALWVGLPLAFGMMMMILGNLQLVSSKMTERALGCMMVINPMAMHLAALDGATESFSRRGYRFDLPGFGTMGAAAFLGVCVLYAAVYLGLAWFAMSGAIKRLERLRTRGG